MTAKRPARNTIYFKGFNEDYRLGGIYHDLESNAVKVLVILQSYCDGYGRLYNHSGKGYSMTELQTMFGMNYRSVRQALLQLQQKKIIQVNADKHIILNNFTDDNVYREADKRGTRRRRLITDQQVESEQRLTDKVDQVKDEIIREFKGQAEQKARTVESTALDESEAAE